MKTACRNTKYIVLDKITREFLGSLKRLRSMFGLSMKQAGEKIGISANAINNCEKGKTIPLLKTLMALAEYYDFDLSESVNYQYWHNLIDFSQLRYELKRYGLTNVELSKIVGYEVHMIQKTLLDRPIGSLICLSAVLEVLDRERKAYNLRNEMYPIRRKRGATQ